MIYLMGPAVILPRSRFGFCFFLTKEKNEELIFVRKNRGIVQSENTQLISEVRGWWALNSVFPHLTQKITTPSYCQHQHHNLSSRTDQTWWTSTSYHWPSSDAPATAPNLLIAFLSAPDCLFVCQIKQTCFFLIFTLLNIGKTLRFYLFKTSKRNPIESFWHSS